MGEVGTSPRPSSGSDPYKSYRYVDRLAPAAANLTASHSRIGGKRDSSYGLGRARGPLVPSCAGGFRPRLDAALLGQNLRSPASGSPLRPLHPRPTHAVPPDPKRRNATHPPAPA